MSNDDTFTFEISLSVLNHLGRNLYRSFITVLGEAVSNSWDADAVNVWIYIDRKRGTLVIKDDGIGMSRDDFQHKFLKIGYSKRSGGEIASTRGRPYIGRKGIGKLALLSCAQKVAVISRKKGSSYVGGVIDNRSLDEAITDDIKPQEYSLDPWKSEDFARFRDNHHHGTILRFEGIREGIKHRSDFLKRMIALYFKFSLLDKSFNILIDDELITLDHLNVLAQKTEFAWKINDLTDPYVDDRLTALKEKIKPLTTHQAITGFIASVEKPRDLSVISTDDRVSIDLFVNGRLRERDVLKHIPTARVVENYLYGQIHFNELDDEKDRFTTSRESIVSDDPKYKTLLESLRPDIIGPILDDWDKWRRKHRETGDSENQSISPKERKSQELYNVVSNEYVLPKGSPNRSKVDTWVQDLAVDAKFNFGSYAECFVSENLIRQYIQKKQLQLSPEAKKEVEKRKKNERRFKGKGGISIDVRKNEIDLGYLSMDYLANLVDKRDANKEACLSRDANEYKPIRDAMMHTALLTNEAKLRLTSVYDNIKGRVKRLLSTDRPDS